eukprot:scaffold58775_cov39-Cyclotella_meneghiniana.AAC.1
MCLINPRLFTFSCILLTSGSNAFTSYINRPCETRVISQHSYGIILPFAVHDDSRPRHEHKSTNIITLYTSAQDDSATTTAIDPNLINETEEAAQKRETPKLTEEDKSLIRTLYNSSDGKSEAMEIAIAADLENMHPRLVVALQLAADKGEWKQNDNEDDDAEFEMQMVALGTALQNVLDNQLRSGRTLLADLLNSGEIRKLDSMIGKAAKDGKLDMSFFTVLGMNMKDAAMMGGDALSLSPTLSQGEGQEEVQQVPPPMEGGEGGGANRLQILQHIYTRCQEELEKNVAPGVGLLNKLLRTDIASIRSNQLSHYLGPQATTITSPDGTTIDLGGSGKPLVSHTEFIEALGNAVNQIRTLEAAGGTDRLSAVNLIENVRQIAIDARRVLVESFGEESDVVR